MDELATLMGVSKPTAVAVVDRGDIASRITPEGHRRVRLCDAQNWLALQARQRATLRDLAQDAQREEGEGPSLPPGIAGDPDDESA